MAAGFTDFAHPQVPGLLLSAARAPSTKACPRSTIALYVETFKGVSAFPLASTVSSGKNTSEPEKSQMRDVYPEIVLAEVTQQFYRTIF